MIEDEISGDNRVGDPLFADSEPGDLSAGDPTAGDPTLGDPAAGDYLAGDSTSGDPGAGDPAVATTWFGSAQSVIESDGFQLTSFAISSIAHLDLGVADARPPLIVASCHTYYTKIFELAAVGAPKWIANTAFNSGAGFKLYLSSAGRASLVYASSGIAVREVSPDDNTVSAAVAIGSADLDQPGGVVVNQDTILVARDSTNGHLVHARLIPKPTGGFDVYALDGVTGPLAASEWGDAIDPASAGIESPRQPALAFDPDNQRLASVMVGANTATSDENAFAVARSPVESGAWTGFQGSFSGAGLSGIVGSATAGSPQKPVAAMTRDGRLVVAAALALDTASRGLMVAIETSSGFAAPDGSADTVLEGVSPGEGLPAAYGDWDVGLCVTDESIAVFFFDSLDSNNVRGIQYRPGSGWDMSFFDADRDTEFDKLAGDETTLDAGANSDFCYLSWEQSDEVFLAGFPVL